MSQVASACTLAWNAEVVYTELVKYHPLGKPRQGRRDDYHPHFLLYIRRYANTGRAPGTTPHPLFGNTRYTRQHICKHMQKREPEGRPTTLAGPGSPFRYTHRNGYT